MRVVVLFGGRSAEHAVSIESARSVLTALDPQRYEAIPVAITHDGRWLPVAESRRLVAGGSALTAAGAGAGRDQPDGTAVSALATVGNQLPEATAGLRDADVVIPLVHGTYGEDGTLQGVLEFAGVPYVGSGVAASAIGMDKHAMRVILRAAGLPLLDWLLVERHARRRDPASMHRQVATRLGFPCFVKPANMGSSVGVHKVNTLAELGSALDDADRYDTRLVVEKAAPGPREIECSVLGNHEPIVSIPGEVVPKREFYDFRAKYLDDDSELRIPAPLTADQTAIAQRLALVAFQALDCAGMARVDLFLQGESFWVNEINTIPGFTRISMYPKLWEASGVPYSQLLDRLIALARERHSERSRLVTQYQEPAAPVAQ
jgi:D-alanine-D-alanine ligase